MFNNVDKAKVPVDEVLTYLKNGWSIGMGRAKYKKQYIVHNNDSEIAVKKEEVITYLEKGYIYGKK
jgi:hypothetical protein